MRRIYSFVFLFALISVMLSGCCVDSSHAQTENLGGEKSTVQSNSTGNGIGIHGDDNSGNAGNFSGDDDIDSAYDSGGKSSSSSEEGDIKGTLPSDNKIASAIVGTWAPYAVYNSDKTKKVSPSTVFGSKFNFGGNIDFASDGSFKSNLCGKLQGKYSVSDSVATVNYDDGSTIKIRVIGYPDDITLEQHMVVNGEEYVICYTM